MSTVIMILNLIPAILKVVRALEEVLPVSGVGPQKLAFIKELVGTDTDPVIIDKVVNAAVKLFNTVGWPKS